MKNLCKKLLIGIMIVVGGSSITAYADRGVALNDFNTKSSIDEAIKQIKKSEYVFIEKEDNESYFVSINGETLPIKKSNILKTIKHEESSLSIQSDNATLKNSPNILGETIKPLNREDVVYRIEDDNTEDNWIKVKTGEGIEGWVYKPYIHSNIVEKPVSTKAYFSKFTTVKSEDNSFTATVGEEVIVIGFNDDKYKISKDSAEYLVSKENISFEKPIVKKVIPKASKQMVMNSIPSSSADAILYYAYQEMGKPYIWGATGPYSFDCSGFVQSVYRKSGISLPRVASDQVTVGSTVSMSNLAKGDLVFFDTTGGISHVGIYIGEDNFIHASSVTEEVTISNLSKDYYSSRFVTAKRVK